MEITLYPFFCFISVAIRHFSVISGYEKATPNGDEKTKDMFRSLSNISIEA